MMKPDSSFEDYNRAADTIRGRFRAVPRIGIVCGSGIGSLADSVESPVAVPYAKIPHWPETTVPGHAGALVLGRLEGWDVAVMRGRLHYYEGYSAEQITFPIRVLRRLGTEALIVTNAAGAVSSDLQPGDLMLIKDHINLMGMGGANPLRGPNDERLGPRFPDMSRAYDGAFYAAAKQAAERAGIPLREGIYACVAGPSFETPAELRYLRQIGADAVGMSTAPEVIAARHGGMRVLGVSVISNRANLDGTAATTHEEVLAAGRKAAPVLDLLVRGFLRNLALP
jgi:purine-nucleoside phosphorylase